MILAPFALEAVLKKLRPAFQSAPIRSLLAPGACDPRALRLPRFSKFEVSHRGLYDVAELPDRNLADELRAVAETVTPQIRDTTVPDADSSACSARSQGRCGGSTERKCR